MGAGGNKFIVTVVFGGLGTAFLGALDIFDLGPSRWKLFLAPLIAYALDLKEPPPWVGTVIWAISLTILFVLSWSLYRFLFRPILALQDASRLAYERLRGTEIANFAEIFADQPRAENVLNYFGYALRENALFGKKPPSTKREIIPELDKQQTYLEITPKGTKLIALSDKEVHFTDLYVRRIDLWRYVLWALWIDFTKQDPMKPEIRKPPPAVERTNISLQVGNEAPLMIVKSSPSGWYHQQRTFSVLVENRGKRSLRDVCLTIERVEPDTRYTPPWILRDNLTLAAGQSVHVPLVIYNEAREPEKGNRGDGMIVCGTEDGRPVLGIDEMYCLVLKATGIETTPAELKVAVWVFENRLNVRNATLPYEHVRLV